MQVALEVTWSRLGSRSAAMYTTGPPEREWRLMAESGRPRSRVLLWPTLLVLDQKGGSATNEEIPAAVTTLMAFTLEQQSELHNDGPRTEIEYRLAWARSLLKGMGLVDNSRRGVWSLTEAGRRLVRELRESGNHERELDVRLNALRLQYRSRRRGKQGVAHGTDVQEEREDETSGDESWRDELLDALGKMEPASFERLAQLLLREAGFVSVSVTGRSGDGGIDGLGVYRVSLLSFPVFFQCKRYQGSVGPGAVRDFRGAMAGRGDKGLLITTGTFTQEAKHESTRDGAPPIDLIDGGRLCDLLKQYGIGVTSRPVEEVHVDEEYFQQV